MKLKTLKISNYRCFGAKEQKIDIDDITAFIGSNSVGKTAALSALNTMFSVNSADRVIKRSDFHLELNENPADIEEKELYIETVFEFPELADPNSKESGDTVPLWANSLVIDGNNCIPYIRIRLEAKWERSSNAEGAITVNIWGVKCPEGEEDADDKKFILNRATLDSIRVIYVPAVREPSKQLKNVSGTMMHHILGKINWSEATKKEVTEKIQELDDTFKREEGVSKVSSSIAEKWIKYGPDNRYNKAELRFSSNDIDSCVKRSEIFFSPSVEERDYNVDELGDGYRSLFYISLVESILSIENLAIKAENKDLFDLRPPILTIVALEEPENHISPHLIGKVIKNLESIAGNNNAQPIISSHSTAIVRRIEPKNIRYFRLDENYNTVVKSLTLPNEETMADQYKYVKEAVKAYPELYFAKLVILGEGDSEQIILSKMWSLVNDDLDLSGISVVPLGGRHVNHFWRLLDDLEIPHITLLDFDLGRKDAGWGRIKYALKQLLKNGYNKEKLLLKDGEVLGDEDLENMSKNNSLDKKQMQYWIDHLKTYNVFFSYPLDIDFLMLEHYKNDYIGILSGSEGPTISITEDGKMKKVKFGECQNIEIKNERIKKDVNACLKENNSGGIEYNAEQKELMVYYVYFFLGRGKPTTHIEALSRMLEEDILENMPEVFKAINSRAQQLLK